MTNNKLQNTTAADPAQRTKSVNETSEAILAELNNFETFAASQIICNVINEFIKYLQLEIDRYNELAAQAEKSMETIAEELRKLRLLAQNVVDQHRNQVMRIDQENNGTVK